MARSGLLKLNGAATATDMAGAGSFGGGNDDNRLNKAMTGNWNERMREAVYPLVPQEETFADPSVMEVGTSDPSAVSSRRRKDGAGESVRKIRRHRSPSQAQYPSGTTNDLVQVSPRPKVRLTDLAGVDDVLQVIFELVALPFISPEIYTHLQVEPPRGVLLHGPPGCGKTMLANAIAGQLGIAFISISAPSIVGGMSGESEKTLRDVFEQAKVGRGGARADCQ